MWPAFVILLVIRHASLKRCRVCMYLPIVCRSVFLSPMSCSLFPPRTRRGWPRSPSQTVGAKKEHSAFVSIFQFVLCSNPPAPRRATPPTPPRRAGRSEAVPLRSRRLQHGLRPPPHPRQARQEGAPRLVLCRRRTRPRHRRRQGHQCHGKGRAQTQRQGARDCERRRRLRCALPNARAAHGGGGGGSTGDDKYRTFRGCSEPGGSQERHRTTTRRVFQGTAGGTVLGLIRRQSRDPVSG